MLGTDISLALTVTLNHYLALSAILFVIGALGVLLRRNLIVILMCIELMLNAVNLSFVAFSHFRHDINGNIMVFFVMTVAAAEAGVGLALVVAFFKRFKDIDIKLFENLKG
jgi:NADH-quinone oxidoreductase subunit K